MALSLDGAKMQSIAMTKILDLAKSVDLTPEAIAKTFKDIGESPEKLRAILNLWFVPRFKPTFVRDPDEGVAGLRDVEFLGAADIPPTQLPYRMFDIDTGDLVEFPSIGIRGQYCMLSHRWKGVELKLGDIKRARIKAMGRATANSMGGDSQKSDVQLLLDQCKLDIEEQEKVIQALFPSGNDALFDLGLLLDRRLRARAIEDKLGRANNTEDEAKTRLRFAEMERKIFSQLVNEVHESVSDKMEGLTRGNGKGHANTTDAANTVVDEIRQETMKAKEALIQAQADYNAAYDDIRYFREHAQIRDGLDELVSRLQRWKSAIKLDRSIQEAARIFKTKLFLPREKRYLWTDTCCIDKTNFGELSESLSLMGDWYALADFTLVQLDTPYSETDAGLDWRRFDSERAGKTNLEVCPPNISSFHNIDGSNPEWSTRAWTLQELVMSKTTFYLNSTWGPLSRPVESLGYLYYLIPFIKLYTAGDTRNVFRVESAPGVSVDMRGFWKQKGLCEVLAGHAVPHELQGLHIYAEKGDSMLLQEAEAIYEAHQMITLLEGLGLRFPTEMSMESATSEVARAVYLAAAELSGPDGGKAGSQKLLAALKEKLGSSLPKYSTELERLSPGEQQEEEAQHAINIVLQCLVAETHDLVLADRARIAKFGQIQQLETWQKGISRAGFSAQDVLELSGKRWATVATDRAYALMGVLGVRFPTFPAEGYAKALARLLDEVVITHNDVSVFNWTGMEMGSPIRGRSMYPCSHTAFGNQEDRGRRYNLLLSAQVQDRVDDVMATYHGVITMLRNTIDFLKDKERDNLPFAWIERIINLVQRSTFQILQPELDSVGKIVCFIMKHCRKATPPPSPVQEKTSAVAASPASAPKSFSLSSLPSLPKTPTLPTISTPSLSLSGLKGPTIAKQEPDSTVGSSKKSSRFGGLGKGIKTPTFGMGKKAADTTPLPEATPNDNAPPPESPALPETPIEFDPPPPYVSAGNMPAKPSWEDINDDVLEYLTVPDEAKRQKLPSEVQSINNNLSSQQSSAQPKTSAVTTSEHHTISPNPIIVNNSGIEGLFDIQRVIITMIDPEKLRRQIIKAASPRDKISGWCSISTGFARVISSFACERRILERELDVIQAVEAKVLREQEKDESEKRSAKLLKTLSVTKATVEKAAQGGVSQLGKATETGGEDSTAVDESTKDTKNSGNTEEELLVSRMIDFIQEPQLQLVAGEWVLARFSGTPGANWFLCHLELGPAPNLFYGHRIATGAIDFGNSTPEPGLVNAWQEYMNRKKRKMCYILNKYLSSRMTAKESEERFKAGSNLTKQGMDIALKGVGGLTGLGLAGANSSTENVTETEQRAEDSDDDSGDEDGISSIFDKVLDQGKLAARAFGEYTVLAVVEKLMELHADQLDKRLSTTVLKRTPRSLRTAVENMNDNKSFLPAMFHSSTRIHMF
ncbi:hypothetical protein QBC35DRAFT_65363 [Podospora australis]|uniref:Heterokaryon incompatibility domain-containing protein n=1 Tax=Podospora australis TaxID=1536484 RepID=A0AAN6WLN0_9PEZI|nr:hypothetical protein QBC35DRAFT_65363 [Podospora australis]